VRTFSHTQRTAVVVLAGLATIATPAWIGSLSQCEFVGINLSALGLGTLFAYFIERLKRENELIHYIAIQVALETSIADSRLNHVLKNKVVLMDHWLSLVRSGLEVDRVDAAVGEGSGHQEKQAEVSKWKELLIEVQASLQECVEWIHRRETFIQFASGRYTSSLQPVSVHKVLQRCAGPDATVQLLDCPPSIWMDVVVAALVVEEAATNARKYGDPNAPIIVRATVSSSDSSAAGGCGDGAGAEMQAQLVVEVDSVDPLDARRLTPEEAARTFTTGFKGRQAAVLLQGRMPYSDGIGLPGAKEAVQAAQGSAELVTRVEDGRVHTIFRLSLPTRFEDSASPAYEQRGFTNAPCSRASSAVVCAARPISSASSKSVLANAVSSPLSVEVSAAAPPSEPEGKRICIVVDDSPMVLEMLRFHILQIGLHEVYTLGSTFEEQSHVEDVIMGLRDPLKPAFKLPPPHTPVEVAVLDLRLALAQPCPPHLKGLRDDGKSVLPVHGIDLALRLRSRGFAGTVILHTAESPAALEEIQQNLIVEGAFHVIQKGSVLGFKMEFTKYLASV